MKLHQSREFVRTPFLLLDKDERIAELPTDFINFLSKSPKNRALGSIKQYALRLRDFCQFLEHHPVYGQLRIDDALRSLGLPVIDEFYKSLTLSGLKAPTIRGHEVVIKMFADWLCTESAGRIHSKSLYDNVSYRTAAPSKRMPRYLTPDEVIQLCLGMHWEIQRLITQFLYDTGVRVSELVQVLKSDIPSLDLYPAGQSFFPLFIRGSKGRGGQIKERYTIISRPVLIRLNKYFKSRLYLSQYHWPEEKKPAFLNSYGETLTIGAAKKFLSDAAARSGLSGRASAHRLRHGTAYSVMRSEHGGTLLDNLLILKEMLGHTSLATVQTYTHIPAPVLKRVAASGDKDMLLRIEQAERIFEMTFIPERKLSKVKRIGVRGG